MRREDFTIAIKNLQDEAIRNRPIEQVIDNTGTRLIRNY